MRIDVTALLLALISTGGLIWTAFISKQRAKKASPIDQAGQVSEMATAQMLRMGEEMEKIKAELTAMEDENEVLRSRVFHLEQEVIRLGGDPGLTLTG